MKKKIMIASVTVFMCLVLTACGSGADELRTTAAETKEAEQEDETKQSLQTVSLIIDENEITFPCSLKNLYDIGFGIGVSDETEKLENEILSSIYGNFYNVFLYRNADTVNEQDDITPDNFKVEVQTGADAMKAEENALVYSFEITDGVINGNAAADIRLGDIVLGTAGIDDVTAVYGHKYEDWEYKEYENLKKGVAELEYDFFPVQLEFKFYDDRLEAITCHIYV